VRKHTLLCCLFLCTIFTTQAQEWLTDFDEAKKIAIEKDRKIILVFQGSDWNGLCKRLDRQIWSNQEFQDYAKEHYVMLKADFPKRRENELSEVQNKKNKKLLDKYNRDGIFPFVVILSKNGEVLGITGYKNVKPYMYIKLLNFFKPKNK